MSAVAFTKLFSTITESTLWVEQPHHVRIVWITMLAMSDRDGYVAASVPGLAARARVTVAEAEEALGVFLSPDRYSRTPDYEGRRIRESMGGWELLNHGKYRRAQSEDSERERKRQWAEENRKRIADKRAAAAAAATESESPRIATVAKSSKVASASASPSGSGSDLDPDPSLARLSERGLPDPGALPLPLLPPPEPSPRHDVDPSGAPEPVQGSRPVWHSLDGWEAPPGLVTEAIAMGLTVEAFDRRLLELRAGPIGGRRGTFDRTDFVRLQLPKWRTWEETERAKARAPASKFGPPAASNALKGGGRWEPTGVHRKFALAKGLTAAEFEALAQKYRAGEDWHDRGRRDADERFGTVLGKAAREKARGK